MICIPITDKTHKDALQTIERSAHAADAVELRMDLIPDGDLPGLIAAARRASKRVKIIVTCRRPEEALLPEPADLPSRREGVSEVTKINLLKQAVELGADFVDIELACGDKAIRQLLSFIRRQKSATQMIVSWHDISKTPSLKELKSIFEACVKVGADIVKIVPYARKMEDNLKVLSLIDHAIAHDQKIIAMCMGELGQISRMMAPIWGSYLGFAVLRGGKKSAPGQLTVRTMKDFQYLLRRNRRSVQPWLLPPGASNFVLLGHPVRHSLSPLMHNKALEAMQIDGHYSAFCVNDLAAAIEGLRGMNIRGASVTIPFKTTVMEYLDEIDEDAAALGAVNTIVNDRGRLAGYNTDWLGLVRALEDRMDIAGKTIVIIGAGGTARAAVYGIKKQGGNPIIVNRTLDKARTLETIFDCPFYPLSSIGKIRAHALINTTSVGMYPQIHQSPVPAPVLVNYELVMDVIYNPWMTRLLRDAEARGVKTIPGLEMFVRQGAGQLKLWTGKEAPLALMRKTVRERLKNIENRDE
jgi:shikimate dehydrogenase/3-dehydroquinate dehydratase type I